MGHRGPVLEVRYDSLQALESLPPTLETLEVTDCHTDGTYLEQDVMRLLAGDVGQKLSVIRLQRQRAFELDIRELGWRELLDGQAWTVLRSYQ